MRPPSNAATLCAGKRKEATREGGFHVRRLKVFKLFVLQEGLVRLIITPLILQGKWIGSSMVEQLTLNQLVEGSSPSRSTKFLSGSTDDWPFLKEKHSCTFLALQQPLPQ
jgi:hypothetical protein